MMGIFDRFIKPKQVEKPAAAAPKVSVPKTKAPEKTAKQVATEAGEPYVTILSMDIDPANLEVGCRMVYFSTCWAVANEIKEHLGVKA